MSGEKAARSPGSSSQARHQRAAPRQPGLAAPAAGPPLVPTAPTAADDDKGPFIYYISTIFNEPHHFHEFFEHFFLLCVLKFQTSAYVIYDWYLSLKNYLLLRAVVQDGKDMLKNKENE